MDFGRVSLDRDLILYLFGTPGQHRFWFMWDDLVRGAIGAVVLVDTRRLADSFPAIDYFEEAGLPFIVALNGFDGSHPHQEDEVREALTLSPHVPLVRTDARTRDVGEGHTDHSRRARPDPQGLKVTAWAHLNGWAHAVFPQYPQYPQYLAVSPHQPAGPLASVPASRGGRTAIGGRTPRFGPATPGRAARRQGPYGDLIFRL